MRQIINWVGGGFFRTIGRTLAFLALGALAYYLFSKSSFDIKDLFFEKVNASAVNSFYHTDSFYYNGNQFATSTLSGYSAISLNGNLSEIFKFGDANGNGVDLGFTDITDVLFAVRLKGPIQSTYEYGSTSCSVSSHVVHPNSSGDFMDDAEIQIDSLSCTNTGYTNDTNNYSVSFRLYSANSQGSIGGWNYCKINFQNIDTNGASFITLECPVWTGAQKIKELVMVTSRPLSQIAIGQDFTIIRRDNSAQSIIDNQNQNTQQIIEQQQNSTQQIMDTNSTETDETATSFFDSFEDTDHGGLSSIITAPLVVINEMLNGVCVQPSATWKGATISLPCGDLLWSRNGASDLKNLLNIFYGGVICYYAIRKLFMMIEGLKDPTQDRIEVIDL